jgi:glycosyltransferase involved in cell wall biosynthesis
MRITIVQGAFLPVPPILGGAVEKIWFGLGKEFASRGHLVTHISRGYGNLAREEFIDGVHHIRVPGFDTPRSLVRLKWRDLLYSRRVLGALPQADVLVTNTFWLPVLPLRPDLGKLYVHVARYPKGQVKFYSKATRLQTVSGAVRNAICAQAPRLAPRVKVIPNFVPRSGSTSIGPERQQSILYVGRVHPEKGIHLLVEAFVQLWVQGLRGWTLRIVGPWEVKQGGGGRQYFGSLREKARVVVGHSVEWTGPIFDVDVLNAQYKESAFFVYPSLAERGESFGLAPLEAMAEGCPPVVSSLECFNDFIRPGSNGWIFNHRGPNAVGSLADTLRTVIASAPALQPVRECARQTAREFSLSSIADQFLNDFEEVVRQ